jgi:V-type H+-transporting ATPase subunit E
MDEPQVSVIGRKEDAAILAQVVPAAVADYKERSGKAVEVKIDQGRFLPAGPTPGAHDSWYLLILMDSAGGVVLTALEGRIISSNTLDARLKLAFEGVLPEIRATLFPNSLGTISGH